MYGAGYGIGSVLEVYSIGSVLAAFNRYKHVQAYLATLLWRRCGLRFRHQCCLGVVPPWSFRSNEKSSKRRSRTNLKREREERERERERKRERERGNKHHHFRIRADPNWIQSRVNVKPMFPRHPCLTSFPDPCGSTADPTRIHVDPSWANLGSKQREREKDGINIIQNGPRAPEHVLWQVLT